MIKPTSLQGNLDLEEHNPSPNEPFNTLSCACVKVPFNFWRPQTFLKYIAKSRIRIHNFVLLWLFLLNPNALRLNFKNVHHEYV